MENPLLYASHTFITDDPRIEEWFSEYITQFPNGGELNKIIYGNSIIDFSYSLTLSGPILMDVVRTLLRLRLNFTYQTSDRGSIKLILLDDYYASIATRQDDLVYTITQLDEFRHIDYILWRQITPNLEIPDWLANLPMPVDIEMYRINNQSFQIKVEQTPDTCTVTCPGFVTDLPVILREWFKRNMVRREEMSFRCTLQSHTRVFWDLVQLDLAKRYTWIHGQFGERPGIVLEYENGIASIYIRNQTQLESFMNIQPATILLIPLVDIAPRQLLEIYQHAYPGISVMFSGRGRQLNPGYYHRLDREHPEWIYLGQSHLEATLPHVFNNLPHYMERYFS
jgi:hypothetical protein